MRDFKNIDRLFQENLKDYEVFPPTKTWNAIDKRLASNPKKNRLPFWVKISSVAALLVLFFSVGTIYFIPQNNFTKNYNIVFFIMQDEFFMNIVLIIIFFLNIYSIQSTN